MARQHGAGSLTRAAAKTMPDAPDGQSARRLLWSTATTTTRESRMDPHSLHGPLKIVAFVVLLLMLAAAVYAGVMAITHWTGIGV